MFLATEPPLQSQATVLDVGEAYYNNKPDRGLLLLVCESVHTHATVHMWRSKDTFQQLVLSNVGSGNQLGSSASAIHILNPLSAVSQDPKK